jgi:hypothetical protein
MNVQSTARGRLLSPASLLRQQIESALAEGFSVDVLTLRLTVADLSYLKRDRSLAVSDISFVDGVMRFLGVAVQQASATSSSLVRG